MGRFADGLIRRLESANEDDRAAIEQALLECLWVFEEQRMANLPLLQRVFAAEEPRVRAAAVRTLGHWAYGVSDWEPTLTAAAQDEHPLVRAEAVKAAVEYPGLAAAEIIFEVANRPLDPEIEAVLAFAKGAIQVDAIVADALETGTPLSAAAKAYVLRNAGVADLLKLERSEAVERAILSREEATVAELGDAVAGLAKRKGKSQLDMLMQLIDEASQDGGNVDGLVKLLATQPREALSQVRPELERIALTSESAAMRQLGFAAWVAAAGPDDAFLAATQDRQRLTDFLGGVPLVDARLRGELYPKVAPLISELPQQLVGGQVESSSRTPGLRVDFFDPHGPDAKRETLDRLQPVESGVADQISLDVPERKKGEKYALRFSGMIDIPETGTYVFFTNSDDGSRLYIGDQAVVNNDGLHGMQEKRGKIELTAGPHPITVTYFNNSGGQGLQVAWKGPDFAKQAIPAERFSVAGGESLHEAAIRALVTIPGHDTEAFIALARLVKAGRSLPAAIEAIGTLPPASWPPEHVRPLVDNLIGYLSGMPARYRTSERATRAAELARALATRLPAAQAQQVESRLQNLDVRVIAIGTVPHRMIYDKERVAVQAGTTVEFRFSNTDAMPHNFAITEPGALQEVGELAEATGREPDAQQRHYIPKSGRILLASRLLQPGENQPLSFEVPEQVGVYPYVCTYPGHWRRMYGALYVVENVEAYQADPDAYLATHALPIRDELLKYNTRSHEWTFEELIAEVKELPPGRSHEVGKELFKVASCVGCHRLDNEGVVFGPDLAMLDAKKRTYEHILRSIVEPSHDIDDKFRSYTFLVNGRSLTGMIVKETDTQVHIVIDPLAKGKPTILDKEEIEERFKSDTSLMPKGTLNKLSREEILDLIAYVFAGGDKKHMLFHEHHH